MKTDEEQEMKVLHVDDLANQNGPESCAWTGNCLGEALIGEDAGQVLSREKQKIGVPTRWATGEGRIHGRHLTGRHRESSKDPTRSETLCMYRSISYGNREIPWSSLHDGNRDRAVNPKGTRRR